MNYDDILLAIKNKNSIDVVISKYITLKKAGSNFKGLCPFHNEKSPSFTVYPNTESYYCFGCGFGGDVITFVEQIENLNYVDTIKLLAEQSGIDLNNEIDINKSNKKTKILEINRAAARYYYNNLLKNKEAMEYLTKRKMNIETIKHFGLGFSNSNWSDLKIHLNSLKYSDEDMLESNLIGKNKNGKYYDRFRNRIMFPIIDVRGNVIAFGGRILPNGDGAKYINSSDTPVYKKSENLYSLQFAKKNKTPFILVEGYLDVISLHQAGYTSAVAALGTSFTKDQAKLIKRYCDSIYIVFDSDNAGKNAANRSIDILSREGIKTKIVDLGECKDPDEFILKHGAEKFSKVLETAENSVEYKILSLKSSFDINTTEGKILFLDKCCEILAKENDSLLQDIYATKLSNAYQVSKSSIITKVEQYNSKLIKNLKKQHFNSITKVTYDNNILTSQKNVHNNILVAQDNIIYLLIKFDEFYDIIVKEIQQEYFDTDFHKKVFMFLCEKINNSIKIELVLFNAEFTQEEIVYIIKLINRPIDKSSLEKLCRESINFLKNNHYEKEAEKIENADDLQAAINKVKQTKMGENNG